MSNSAVVNSIGGELNSQAKDPAGEWKFVYSRSDQTLSLDISMNEERVGAELNESEIDQLIEWLQNVQHELKARTLDQS